MTDQVQIKRRNPIGIRNQASSHITQHHHEQLFIYIENALFHTAHHSHRTARPYNFQLEQNKYFLSFFFVLKWRWKSGAATFLNFTPTFHLETLFRSHSVRNWGTYEICVCTYVYDTHPMPTAYIQKSIWLYSHHPPDIVASSIAFTVSKFKEKHYISPRNTRKESLSKLNKRHCIVSIIHTTNVLFGTRFHSFLELAYFQERIEGKKSFQKFKRYTQMCIVWSFQHFIQLTVWRGLDLEVTSILLAQEKRVKFTFYSKTSQNESFPKTKILT